VKQMGFMQATTYILLVLALPSNSIGTSKHTHCPVAFTTTWPMCSHSLLSDGLVEDVKGITWYCGFLLLKSVNIFFLASSSDSEHSMSNVSDSKLRLRLGAGMHCAVSYSCRTQLSQRQVTSRYVFAHPVVRLCSLTHYSHVRF